jgi:chromosome segregation ATPase
MPCLFGRAEAEKAELRELLELSNSQREEYRKAAEGASRRAEHVGKQLEARLAELQDLSGHYQVLHKSAALLLLFLLLLCC